MLKDIKSTGQRACS